MYWCKKQLVVVASAGILLAIGSCKQVGGTVDNKKFFDLKAYFTSEVARLTKSDPLVAKTAVQNKESETLRQHIKNWDSELSLFVDADINKPAWANSYSVSEAEG